MDASHVYARALALGCSHSLISTQIFRRALTASVDSRAEKMVECPFSGVTKSGSLEERAEKRCSECGTNHELLDFKSSSGEHPVVCVDFNYSIILIFQAAIVLKSGTHRDEEILYEPFSHHIFFLFFFFSLFGRSLAYMVTSF